MKNPKRERLLTLQREYHRHHPWRLSNGGLFIPHSYADKKPADLTWWDDVGFILNRRRVIVWFQHPRHVYSDAICTKAWEEAGDDPKSGWPSEGGTKNYRKLGASRKKVVSYSSRQPSAEQSRYYDHLHTITQRLGEVGIDHDVVPSRARTRMWWATGLSLIAPLEVQNESELASVAALARRLILGETTLAAEFPNYRYTRANWLNEIPGCNSEK